MYETQWEDYIVKGERAEEAAAYMEAFAADLCPDPLDRLYPAEDYLGAVGEKVKQAAEEFGVTFILNL